MASLRPSMSGGSPVHSPGRTRGSPSNSPISRSASLKPTGSVKLPFLSRMFSVDQVDGPKRATSSDSALGGVVEEEEEDSGNEPERGFSWGDRDPHVSQSAPLSRGPEDSMGAAAGGDQHHQHFYLEQAKSRRDKALARARSKGGIIDPPETVQRQQVDKSGQTNTSDRSRPATRETATNTDEKLLDRRAVQRTIRAFQLWQTQSNTTKGLKRSMFSAWQSVCQEGRWQRVLDQLKDQHAERAESLVGEGRVTHAEQIRLLTDELMAERERYVERMGAVTARIGSERDELVEKVAEVTAALQTEREKTSSVQNERAKLAREVSAARTELDAALRRALELEHRRAEQKGPTEKEKRLEADVRREQRKFELERKRAADMMRKLAEKDKEFSTSLADEPTAKRKIAQLNKALTKERDRRAAQQEQARLKIAEVEVLREGEQTLFDRKKQRLRAKWGNKVNFLEKQLEFCKQEAADREKNLKTALSSVKGSFKKKLEGVVFACECARRELDSLVRERDLLRERVGAVVSPRLGEWSEKAAGLKGAVLGKLGMAGGAAGGYDLRDIDDVDVERTSPRGQGKNSERGGAARNMLPALVASRNGVEQDRDGARHDPVVPANAGRGDDRRWGGRSSPKRHGEQGAELQFHQPIPASRKKMSPSRRQEPPVRAGVEYAPLIVPPGRSPEQHLSRDPTKLQPFEKFSSENKHPWPEDEHLSSEPSLLDGEASPVWPAQGAAPAPSASSKGPASPRLRPPPPKGPRGLPPGEDPKNRRSPRVVLVDRHGRGPPVADPGSADPTYPAPYPAPSRPHRHQSSRSPAKGPLPPSGAEAAEFHARPGAPVSMETLS